MAGAGSWLCCRRRRRKYGLKDIEKLQENYFRKEARRRKDSSTSVGRRKVNAKPITRRKAQKSTGSTIAQNGTKSDGGSQKLPRKWEQKAKTSKDEWKWQRGIVTHPLSVSQWNSGRFSVSKWSLRSTRVVAFQLKVSSATLQKTALFFFLGGHDGHGVRDGTEIRLACGSLAKTSELIRSLRDDEQGNHRNRERKWLRVHDESEWSLITSLI